VGLSEDWRQIKKESAESQGWTFYLGGMEWSAAVLINKLK
jgi:hypothetical protein